MSRKFRSVTIGVPEEWATLLETIGPLDDVIHGLIDHAQQGVLRPGAWERGWLAQAFGLDFLSKLEADPDRPIYQRPKK